MKTMHKNSMNHMIVNKIRDAGFVGNEQMFKRIKMHADLRRYIVYYCIDEGSVGAEVGVDWGAFTDVVLDIITPSKYYLIDPWSQRTKNSYENIKEKYKHLDFIEPIKSTGVAAAENIPDESLDWAYIDCSHTKKDVTNNVKAYMPKVKKGGYIIGDDTHITDVYDAFNDLINKYPDKIELVIHDNLIANNVIVRKL